MLNRFGLNAEVHAFEANPEKATAFTPCPGKQLPPASATHTSRRQSPPANRQPPLTRGTYLSPTAYRPGTSVRLKGIPSRPVGRRAGTGP